MRRFLRARFATTLPRFDLMAALERAPDGLTMGELSRRLMVSGGNITSIVERASSGMGWSAAARQHPTGGPATSP